MASQWQSCPHCKVLFQADTTSPARQCPACRGALAPVARLIVAPVAVLVPTTAPPVAAAVPIPVTPVPAPARPAPAVTTVIPPPRPAGPPGWFYARNKKKLGPVTRAQLEQLAASGTLTPGDMLLEEGTRKWLVAATLPGLFPAPPPVPAPVPPAPPRANGPPAPPAQDDSPPTITWTGPLTEEPKSGGWYYARNKKKVGPIPREQLETLANSGQLLREDMVLREGSTKWVPAGSVDDLFPQVTVSELTMDPAPAAPQEVQPLPARPRPHNPRSCPHCKGTAFCGRFWDADGMVLGGDVCADCKEHSGLPAEMEVDKVTCSVCQGMGFQAEAEEPGVRKDAIAWRLRGLALSDSGQYDRAIAAYSEAIRLAPRYATAYYERGWAYLATGRTELGDADLAESARLADRYAAAQETATPTEKRGWLARWFGR
ncbi:MAG: GYF domain-containing protein [Gemmataceae bacterium]|nr:GYF domain-containing protein [Gemmataceae bacterium]